MTTLAMKERIKSAIDELEDEWMIHELAELLGLGSESEYQHTLTEQQESLIAQSEKEISAGMCYSDEEVFNMSEEWLGK